MSIPPPIVRYMLLCDDWRVTPDSRHRIVVGGLLTNLHATDEPPFPLTLEEMCVVLLLTEGRGTGRARIVAVFEETGEPVFTSGEREIEFGPDLLDVVGVPFRLQACPFRKPGIYSIQFWYHGAMLDERPLRLVEG